MARRNVTRMGLMGHRGLMGKPPFTFHLSPASTQRQTSPHLAITFQETESEIFGTLPDPFVNHRHWKKTTGFDFFFVEINDFIGFGLVDPNKLLSCFFRGRNTTDLSRLIDEAKLFAELPNSASFIGFSEINMPCCTRIPFSRKSVFAVGAAL